MLNLLNKKIKFRVNNLLRYGTIESICINNSTNKVEYVRIISKHNNWHIRGINEIEVF